MFSSQIVKHATGEGPGCERKGSSSLGLFTMPKHLKTAWPGPQEEEGHMMPALQILEIRELAQWIKRPRYNVAVQIPTHRKSKHKQKPMGRAPPSQAFSREECGM